jgi:hypothetical protein
MAAPTFGDAAEDSGTDPAMHSSWLQFMAARRATIDRQQGSDFMVRPFPETRTANRDLSAKVEATSGSL